MYKKCPPKNGVKVCNKKQSNCNFRNHFSGPIFVPFLDISKIYIGYKIYIAVYISIIK